MAYSFSKKATEILEEADRDRATRLQRALEEAYEQGIKDARTKILLEFLDADGKYLYSFAYSTEQDSNCKSEINLTQLTSSTVLRITSR